MSRRRNTAPVDPEAPHGRDADGVPLAPYGLKVDGTPRRSRRGAQPGQRGNGGPAATGGSAPGLSKVDKQRRAALLGLLESCVTMPMVGLAMSPMVERRIGERQAMALAGDALILTTYAEPLADSLVVLSQSRPALLAWLDTLEERAPYLMLAQVGVQVVKALVGNHLNPSPVMAQAAANMARVRAMQLAEEINREAASLGIPTEVPVPDAEAA